MLFAEGIVVDSVYLLALFGGAGGIIAFLFKQLISSKDRELASLRIEKDKESAELESMKRSYQEIAQEAVKSATETANYYRQREGKSPIVLPAPVISESHSPSTAAQREAALIQTLRASMAKVKLMTGQEPRTEPPHALELPKALVLPNDEPAAAVALMREIEKIDLVKTIDEIPEKTAEKVIEAIKEEGGQVERDAKG